MPGTAQRKYQVSGVHGPRTARVAPYGVTDMQTADPYRGPHRRQGPCQAKAGTRRRERKRHRRQLDLRWSEEETEKSNAPTARETAR